MEPYILLSTFSKGQSRYSCQYDVVQNKVLVFIEICYYYYLGGEGGGQGVSLRRGHGNLIFFLEHIAHLSILEYFFSQSADKLLNQQRQIVRKAAATIKHWKRLQRN